MAPKSAVHAALALALLLLGLCPLTRALPRNHGEYESEGHPRTKISRTGRAARPLGAGEFGPGGVLAGAPGEKQPRYDTAYACEGKTLSIQCHDGELISLIRANYGRFSITICNDQGNTEWSVNCMSTKSLRVLHQKCSQQQNCTVMAHTSTFGDPCPGTLKYLEAHYQCTPATTTTPSTRVSPPWLHTSQPSVWTTAKLPPSVIKPVPAPQPPAGAPPSPTTSSPVPTPTSTARQAPTTPSHRSTKSPPKEPKEGAAPSSRDREQSERPPTVEVGPRDSSGPSAKEKNNVEVSPVQVPAETPSVPPAISSSTASTASSADTSNTLTSSNSWFQGELSLCNPTMSRGLYWNWTRSGETNDQPCPGGATGIARWRCSQSATWMRESPDLSDCRSVWLTNLQARVDEGDAISTLAGDLSQVTNRKTLYGGDMMTTTEIIRSMARKMEDDIKTFPDQQQKETIVKDLLTGAVRTGSNLLDASQKPSWQDLSFQDQMKVATSLLVGLEENAFLLADLVLNAGTVLQPMKNILLSVRVLRKSSLEEVERFPRESDLEAWNGRLLSESDQLELPKGSLISSSDGLVRLVFVAFDRLEEILQPRGDPVENSVGVNSNATRVLNSKVISASMGKGKHIQLSKPVRLSLRHLRTENVSNPSCVFWDYSMSAWAEEGCRIHTTNYTHTVCECDHLTNFAVLMDIHSTLLAPVHQTALRVITYVGCIVSIVCLVLAILTFQLFQGLKVKREIAGNHTPRRHLCSRSRSPTSRSSTRSHLCAPVAHNQLCVNTDTCGQECTQGQEACGQHNHLCAEASSQVENLLSTLPRRTVREDACSQDRSLPCQANTESIYIRSERRTLPPCHRVVRQCAAPCSTPCTHTLTRSCGDHCSRVRTLQRPPSCLNSPTVSCSTPCTSVCNRGCGDVYSSTLEDRLNHPSIASHTCEQSMHSLAHSRSCSESIYWSRRPPSRQRSARHETSCTRNVPRLYSQAHGEDSPEYEYIS